MAPAAAEASGCQEGNLRPHTMHHGILSHVSVVNEEPEAASSHTAGEDAATRIPDACCELLLILAYLCTAA